MALTNGSISNGREKAKSIKTDLNEARVLVAKLNSFLNQNENYNLFVEGTDYGKIQDSKLKTIIKILDQNLTAQTTTLIMRLNEFFNHQEELNKRAAEARRAAAEANTESIK